MREELKELLIQWAIARETSEYNLSKEAEQEADDLYRQVYAAIDAAIEAARTQPDQEPFGYLLIKNNGDEYFTSDKEHADNLFESQSFNAIERIALYTKQQPDKKPLTDDEIGNIIDGGADKLTLTDFAREIEKAHSIKEKK